MGEGQRQGAGLNFTVKTLASLTRGLPVTGGSASFFILSLSVPEITGPSKKIIDKARTNGATPVFRRDGNGSHKQGKPHFTLERVYLFEIAGTFGTDKYIHVVSLPCLQISSRFTR